MRGAIEGTTAGTGVGVAVSRSDEVAEAGSGSPLPSSEPNIDPRPTARIRTAAIASTILSPRLPPP